MAAESLSLQPMGLERVLSPLRRAAAALRGVIEGVRALRAGHVFQQRVVRTKDGEAGVFATSRIHRNGDIDQDRIETRAACVAADKGR